MLLTEVIIKEYEQKNKAVFLHEENKYASHFAWSVKAPNVCDYLRPQPNRWHA